VHLLQTAPAPAAAAAGSTSHLQLPAVHLLLPAPALPCPSPDGDVVLEGLGHLEACDGELAHVQEVVDPLLAAAAGTEQAAGTRQGTACWPRSGLQHSQYVCCTLPSLPAATMQ
jgi:hypothetical protein